MNDERDDGFRHRVKAIAEKGLNIMEEDFEGTRKGTDKVNEASKMIGFGVKVSHMDQLKVQHERSQAIRLLPYIPKEKRGEYISLTNPTASPYLLGRPSK